MQTFGRTEVYVDSLDIKAFKTPSQDTLWFVNHMYNTKTNSTDIHFKLKFTNYDGLGITGGIVRMYKINPVTGQNEGVYGSDINFSKLNKLLDLKTIGEGLYQLEFNFNDLVNSKVIAFFFNKEIEFDIEPVKVKEGDCLSKTSDTCIYTLKNHRYNPKGTKYKMEGSLADEDIKVDEKKPEGIDDIFYVIFNGPTGYNDLFLTVKGSFENPRNKKEIYSIKSMVTPLRKYDKPDLNRIFNFDTTNVEDLNGCTEVNLSGFSYNEDMNKKYMDFMRLPDFKTKENFKINYYKKDSLNQVKWELISDEEKDRYVNDSTNFHFLQAGIYRIWMIDSNYCGVDTLDTEVVYDGSRERNIIINRNDVKQLEFKNNTLCLSGEFDTDTLVIVDRASRFNWEDIPEYKATIYQILKDQAGVDSLSLVPEDQADAYFSELTPEIAYDERGGCDSTTLQYVFRRMGNYRVVLEKTSICSVVSDSVFLKVAKAPVLAEGFLDQSAEVPLNMHEFCGEFVYTIPSEIEADSNESILTQYEWKFGRGSEVRVFADKRPEIGEITFDSLSGVASYITLKVGNSCGWSDPDSVSFFTFSTPQVVLWRDSVPDNDTLCYGREYKYHFKGKFPEHFLITPMGTANDSILSVYVTEVGERSESFTIINTDHPNCKQVLEDLRVWFLVPPLLNVMDTVHFCETTVEIQTHELLESSLISYEKLAWNLIKPEAELTLPGTDFPDDFDVEKRKDFPRFVVADDTTLLTYLVLNGGETKGGGCVNNGQVVLIRETAPLLEIKQDKKWVCENKELNVAALLNSEKKLTQNLKIDINGERWFSSEGDNWEIGNYLCSPETDTVTVVFGASQLHTYTGNDGCDLKDSVKIAVLHPRIKILKQDTVYSGDYIYRFDRIKNYTDTAFVKDLTWKVVRGKNASIEFPGGSDPVFGGVYNFSSETHGESVFFELSGTTWCGDKLKDTLRVFFPKIELRDGRTHICDNIPAYRLWSNSGEEDRISGFFVDTTTLSWSVESGSGEIHGVRSGAYLVLPENVDRGETKIKATVKDIEGVERKATLTIRIHKAPRMKLKKDYPDGIILAGDDRLSLDKVVDFEEASTSIVLSASDVTKGTVIGTKQYLPAYLGYINYLDTVYVSMGVKGEDQPGCGMIVKDSLPLVIYPNPGVVIHEDTLKICELETITVGKAGYGQYNIEGYSDLVTNWSVKSGCTDCLKNEDLLNKKIDFHSPGAGYETLMLSAEKNVVNYEGVMKQLTGRDSIVIKSHGKPIFEISRRRDTICYGTTFVDITGISVTTVANDPIKYHRGPGLYAAVSPAPGKYTLPLMGEDSAKVYVTAIQEGCDKWVDERDSITIVRLPELEAVLARTKDSVCSNKQLDIVVTKANTPRFNWTTTEGGTLTNTATLAATYIPVDGVLRDTIVFTALPMLKSCTDSKVVKEAINVVVFEGLVLMNDTICSSVREYQPDLRGGDLIKRITWTSASGGSFKDNENQVIKPVYIISDADRNAGEVELIAEIELRDPCGDITPVEKRMKLTILTTPDLTYDPADAVVCQGDSIHLDFITFSSGIAAWDWSADLGHFNDVNQQYPYYFPEENSGHIYPAVILSGSKVGTYACNSSLISIPLVIKEAEKPDILIEGTICQGKEVLCKVLDQAVVYRWITSESQEKNGKEVLCTFAAEGKQWVDLEVTYANGCKRTAADTVEVKPIVKAEFEPDSTIVGVGREISFINQAAEHESRWWYVDGVNVSDGEDLYYTFSSSGVYKVGLEVSNRFGCRDTVYKEIRVLVKPIARFSVALENPDKPCDGSKAIFTNLTEGADEYCSYKWVLNTDITAVDTTTEVPTGDVYYYASDNQDTTYRVTLIVGNAAGSDTADYQNIKIISHIKAALVPLDKEVKCAGFDKEFINRTRGTADWYRIQWGDGTDTTLTDAVNRVIRHKYSNSSYEIREDTVRLAAGNMCEEDSIKFAIKIMPNTATAKIKVDEKEGCYMFDAKFQNVSVGFGGIQKALWDFGEGGPLEENNTTEPVNHLYQQPGIYKVTLTVYDACNTSADSVKIQVKGNNSLAYRIKEETTCSGQPVSFEVVPEIKDQFYDYYWNFDYGNSEVWEKHNELNVKKIWNDVVNCRVALKATSLDGCETNSYYQPIEVKKTPLVDFQFRYQGETDYKNHDEVIEGCQPVRVEFKNLGAGSDDRIFWDFSDGGTSSGSEAVHLFADAGNPTMKMKVISENGCIDSLEKGVLVKETPEALFRNLGGNLFCAGGPVHLNIENTGKDQENTTYVWSYQLPDADDYIFWDDKVIPGEKYLDYQVGNVVLKLVATDKQSGCVVEKTDTIISSSPISKGFTIEKEKLCAGEEIVFQVAAHEGDEIRWDLGDASSFIHSDRFTYAYDQAGKYEVNLNIRNKYGCKENVAKTVYVYPLPEADFGYEEDDRIFGASELPEGIDMDRLPKIKNGGIRFTNRSFVKPYSFATGNLEYEWNFGDGSPVVSTSDPAHLFKNNGFYEVKLVVKTEQGCVDSLLDGISIDAVKGLFIPNAFAPGAGIEENPGVALFQPKGIGLLTYRIKVYDVSGTCVWSSDKLEDGKPAEAWDGTFKGSPLPKNFYTWEVNAVFIDGTVWTGEDGHTQGYVMLIR